MATKLTTAAASAATAAPAAPITPTPSRAYLTALVDEASGELTETSRFRYLPGHPRQVRFEVVY